MLNILLIKKVMQWLLIGSMASWYVQCHYSSDDDEIDYRVYLETLDTFQQNVSDFGWGEPIDLQLTLTNTGTRDLFFNFTSSQQFDFYIFRDNESTPLWQWSVAASRVFLPMITTRSVPENGSWAESVTWDQTDNDGDAVAPGTYRVEGTFLGIATRSRTIYIF